MKTIRFWGQFTLVSLGKLCQRPGLLAGLTLLCLLLPLLIGPAAESALSQGVSFSGITLAVTAPEGDNIPELLTEFMPKMTDISEYCSFVALEPDQARQALEQDEITAILVLPEDFVQGILNGTNPDVELIVSGQRPLESLLTLWVGQSASDLLAAFQSGIYAVLDLYDARPPEGLSWNAAMTGINLRYINQTLNRQDLFRTQTISATEQLPIPLHYGLSLLFYLVLSLAPLFLVVYDRSWLSAQRRLRSAGRGSIVCYLCSLSACTLVLFPMIAAGLVLLTGAALIQALGCAFVCAFFCAGFGAVCCLLTADTGTCGALSFSCSLVFLALSGGILPPVLLPKGLRSLMDLSPITWLRTWATVPMGEYDPDPVQLWALLFVSAGLILLGVLLYRRRSMRKEADQ